MESGASGPGTMPSPGFMEGEPKLPSRVNFAFDVVHWANQIERGDSKSTFDHAPSEGRLLREDEKAVYGAALEVMRLYLTGEMLFDDEYDHNCDAEEQAKEEEAFACQTEDKS